MKLKYCLLIVFFLLMIIGFAMPVNAETFSETEAKKWTDDKGKEILEILTSANREEKFLQLDELLYNDVDLDYAAKFVVGKYWKNMTPEQKEEYIPLFKRYTAALYKGYPLEINKGSVTYNIDKVIAENNNRFVYCTIFIKNLNKTAENVADKGVNVIFRLVKNNGKIKVRDLQIAESSFLHAYRERFYKIIHEEDDDDIGWFMEDLKQLTVDLEEEIVTKKSLENPE